MEELRKEKESYKAAAMELIYRKLRPSMSGKFDDKVLYIADDGTAVSISFHAVTNSHTIFLIEFMAFEFKVYIKDVHEMVKIDKVIQPLIESKSVIYTQYPNRLN